MESVGPILAGIPHEAEHRTNIEMRRASHDFEIIVFFFGLKLLVAYHGQQRQHHTSYIVESCATSQERMPTEVKFGWIWPRDSGWHVTSSRKSAKNVA